MRLTQKTPHARRQLWLALLCVAGLLARLSGPAMPASPLAMLLDPSAICHAPGDTTPFDQAPGGAGHACEVCPACAVALQALVLPAAATVPMPVSFVARAAVLRPDATGPPAHPPGPGQPRGPPALSA